jgi:hypothetical protein
LEPKHRTAPQAQSQARQVEGAGGRGELAPDPASFKCPPPASTTSLSPPSSRRPLSSSLCCTSLPRLTSDPTVSSPVLRGTEAFVSARQARRSPFASSFCPAVYLPTCPRFTTARSCYVLGFSTLQYCSDYYGNQRRDDLLSINQFNYYFLFRLIRTTAAMAQEQQTTQPVRSMHARVGRDNQRYVEQTTSSTPIESY